MPSLYLSANPTPSGTQFPGTPDDLLNQIAQYISVLGIGGFSGINFGATIPLAADRDKPWLETNASGAPVAWKTWDGSDWVEMVFPVPTGGTSSRPSNPVDGQTFFDTDINTALVWERALWRTLDGVPGDIKYVEAATIDDAETNNPGWYRVADYYGRVIVSAGAGAGLTSRAFGDTGGSETETAHNHSLPATTGGHTLTLAEIPSHTHGLTQLHADGGNSQSPGNNVGRQQSSPIPETTDSTGGGGSHTHPIGGNTGSNSPVADDNMQPFICAWLIRKA